jgi:acyl dehydratase
VSEPGTAIRALVGKELGPSTWVKVGQPRIDLFAEATGDPQWIHTDPELAAQGPYGTTIAHGFLTLSLCIPMLYEVLSFAELGYVMGINYGVNRVRFPAAVPSGGRIRGTFRVDSVEDVPGGQQAVLTTTVECEGVEKPVCVAELVVRMLAPLSPAE